ncbi:hypothetical protein EDC44_10925 [Cricetibacter osteomyelitidis]|uniref:Uncharacterized protein n=1 Tax=Cricetibacter osteomyelitidis TaxID=1521931 RepID=A0A4V2T1Y8_9PAST|nr:hypothetical protein [Cricetibacter osteomyelitidis]TCP95333.1 hypothetical protein EDC44_10925 [Cricetibacter osteomyelitidis]
MSNIELDYSHSLANMERTPATAYLLAVLGEISELTTFNQVRIFNGRNAINDLERLNNFELVRVRKPKANGKTHYTAYRVANKKQCETLIKLYQLKAKQKGYPLMTKSQISIALSRFNDKYDPLKVADGEYIVRKPPRPSTIQA